MRNEQLQKDCRLPYASHGHAAQVVAALQAAGAAAVLIHGRTQEQRYNKAANWDLISRVAGAASVPIIGNGDVLTLFEVTDVCVIHDQHRTHHSRAQGIDVTGRNA
jgi:tRNA-dihydrouridine synthase